MTFLEAVERCCFEKYASFSGRAPRSEFWWFYVFTFLFTYVVAIVFFGIGYLCGDTSGGFIAMAVGVGLYCLLMFLPSLAVTVRRLHDTGRSGWWYLISFVPFIGGICLFVFLLLDSQEENEYGLPLY